MRERRTVGLRLCFLLMILAISPASLWRCFASEDGDLVERESPLVIPDFGTITPIVRVSPTIASDRFSVDAYVHVSGRARLGNPFLHTKGPDTWRLIFVTGAPPAKASSRIIGLGRDECANSIGTTDLVDGAVCGRRFWISAVKTNRMPHRCFLQLQLIDGFAILPSQIFPDSIQPHTTRVTAASTLCELPFGYEWTARCLATEPPGNASPTAPLEMRLETHNASRGECTAIFCNISQRELLLLDPFARYKQGIFRGDVTLWREGSDTAVLKNMESPPRDGLLANHIWVDRIPPNAIVGGIPTRMAPEMLVSGRYKLVVSVQNGFVVSDAQKQEKSDQRLITSECVFDIAPP